MYDILEITIKKSDLEHVGFLADNPSKCWYKDGFFKLIYFKPFSAFLSPFNYEGVQLSIREKESTIRGWELVRDRKISVAKDELMNFLEDLEIQSLQEQRAGRPLALNGWLLDTVSNGISTKEETTAFIKLLYFNGYDPTEIINLFARLTNKADLAKHFISKLRKVTGEGKSDRNRPTTRAPLCA